MRFWGIFCLLGFSGCASASFEMALMYDYTDHKIQRYDPVNNVMLGSFGSAKLGTYRNVGLSLDPTRPGEVAVLNGDATVRWINYSTGLVTKFINLPGGHFFANTRQMLSVTSSGDLLVTGYTSGTSTRLFNNSGTLLATMNQVAGHTVLDAEMAPDGTIYGISEVNTSGSYQRFWSRYQANGSRITFGNILTAFGQPFRSWEMALQGNRIMLIGDQSHNLTEGTISGGSVTWTQRSGWNNGIPSSYGIQFGHLGEAGFFNTSLVSGSTYTTSYFNAQPTGTYWEQNVVPSTHQFNASVLVVAPEPGTMAALGLGALALLKRRRN